MSKFMNIFTASLLALAVSPAYAFFDQMISGMTSVTNNLIDSSENVAVQGMNTTSTTVLVLSNDIGKMADRINVMADKIGVMADRIGVMADRIVTTEQMMSGFAHKLVDTGAELARGQQAGYYPRQFPAQVFTAPAIARGSVTKTQCKPEVVAYGRPIQPWTAFPAWPSPMTGARTTPGTC